MSEHIPAGQLDVPKGWEVSTEIRMIEPASSGMAAPLSVKKAGEKSRAGITVSRYVAPPTEATAALASFLKRLAQHAPNMKRIGEGTLRFADGGEGQYAVISYELEPGRSAAQCHVFRLDRETVSHLTATVEAFDAARIQAELLPLLATFRPI